MDNGNLLEGLRVVEAAAFVAAPLGGMTLAQMGAEVIRIDALGGGLDYRRWPVASNGSSLFWAGLNKGKKSVTLDLGSAEGREVAMALIAAPGEDAGLLLTNFPPRGWLDHDKLRERRDDLIQLTVQGDRHGGSAVDYTINPRMGLPYLTGSGDAETAVNHVLPAWDLVTGQMAAVGLLAAERHRRRRGVGQHVKLALEDVALAAVGHLGLLAEAQLGQARGRHGNHLFGAFGHDFASADGVRVMVVGLTGKQWRALCDALAMGEEMDAISRRTGRDLAREGDRFFARQQIAEVVARWIGARPFAEVAAQFDRHGVCWGKYQTVSQLVAEDEACSLANPMFGEIDQHGVGRLVAPGLPLEFSAVPRRAVQPAPRLGADTEQVLHAVLGIDSAEFGRLHDRGVVGA
ncbi:CoA transferase [Variovorax sp. UMC13]|uniref:CoA transferase n=1 Tax=Variovorax sp. UMC13 TaxID=1862326 RepID=UPI00160204B5|nr:CoA transferase [Variovorax sp. UMC13]MBB1600531.1 mesaconyl-CoA isomerase [Variovorax sp. UMC13]